MKFILNEHKKFILEEKYILKEADQLTEASVADVAMKWTNHFKNTLENTKKVLEKYINFSSISKNSANTKDAFTKTKNAINKTWSELEVSLSMPDNERAASLLAMKAELKKYIEALKTVPTEILDKKSKDTITLLNSRITDLTALDTKTTWEKKDIAELTEIHQWVEAKVLPLFDVSDIENSANTAENFKKVCENCLKLIDDITSNLPESFTDFDEETLKNYISIMKISSENTTLQDVEKINKGLVIANLNTYLKQVTTLEQNYMKINNSGVITLSKANIKKQADEKEAAKKRAEEEEAERLNPTVDWYELYKQCSESKNRQQAYNAFWNGGFPLADEANPNDLPVAINEKIKKGYYIGEWGNQAELVKSFGTHFTDTLSEYGWSAKLNPFITILKYLFKLDKITINDASFDHLVAAMDGNLITEKDMLGNGILGTTNLIFNPQLYSKSTEMIDYLRWQKTFIANRAALPDDSDLKTTYINIMSTEGNQDDLNNKIAFNTAKSTNFNYTLRPLEIVKGLIKTKLAVENEPEVVVKKATDEQVAKVLKSITDDAIAKKFLSYIINTYRIIAPELINNLSSNVKDKAITNKNTVATSVKDDTNFDKLIGRVDTKYSKEQFETLISEVIKIAGI